MKKAISFILFILLLVSCVQAKDKLLTSWAQQVSAGNVWPEYPRPQLTRNDWLNLNGQWEYAVRPKDQDKPETFDGTILVPFCIESTLSGVGKTVSEDEKLWYRRTFEIPENWAGKRILLNFDAVDWETTVWVNWEKVGSHKGGYDPFSFDITDKLTDSGTQEIVISVWDPTDTSFQSRGKQVKNPGGIFYTAVTGIWQTVWLEPVNEAYIKSLKIIPDIDDESVQITAECGDADNVNIEIKVEKNGVTVAESDTKPGKSTDISIKNPELWSPDNPFLYDLEITLKDEDGEVLDEIGSY
ncbi:MAG: glycoside hydrolase family 2 protein, partial [Planctomycetota bacterium]